MINQIFSSMPINDYHKHDSLSASKIKHILKSPKNYWHEYLNPKKLEDDEDKEMKQSHKLGQGTHVLTLEPHLFDDQFFGLPKLDRRKNEDKARYADLMRIHEGKTELKEEEYLRIEGMSNAVKQTKLYKLIKSDGKIETSFFWVDTETNLQIKSRPDWHNSTIYIELKTTQDINRFSRDIFNNKYYVQAAMAREAFKYIYNKKYDRFCYLVVESKAPYLTDYFVLENEVLDRGEFEYRQALEIYKDCITKNEWPGLKESFKSVYLPAWM